MRLITERTIMSATSSTSAKMPIIEVKAAKLIIIAAIAIEEINRLTISGIYLIF